MRISIKEGTYQDETRKKTYKSAEDADFKMASELRKLACCKRHVYRDADRA